MQCGLTILVVLSTLALAWAEDDAPPFRAVRCELIPLPNHQVSFRIDGIERTRWHYGPEYPRPFFYPFNGPSGVSLTRMGHPGANDHDHHRSVWFAFHKVNDDLNFWADGTGTQIRQKQWFAYEDGDEEAIMAYALGYFDQEGNELMEQGTVAAIRPLTDPGYELEIQITLQPPADRKETTLAKTNFGLLAVRVAKTLSEHFGGGQLTNSKGDVGEPDIFAKPARWMDYSGPIVVGAGAGRETVVEGITYIDHPSNPRHPTKWHVRSDGWMGASLCMDAGITITRENPLVLRYLLVAHSGACDAARANESAQAFAERPPFEVGKRSTPHRQWEVWRKTALGQGDEHDYWIPTFDRDPEETLADGLHAKLGGWPWGFPVARWPQCEGCDHAMTHLAQLVHVPKVLDLGDEDAVLHVFQCEANPGICMAWEHDSGCSATVLLKRSELGRGRTRPPEKTRRLREFRLSGWKAQSAPNYFEHELVNAESWFTDAYFKVSEEVLSQVVEHDFKSGGLPHWTGQTPRGFPGPPYQFLAQFGSMVPLRGSEELRQKPHASTWANFGSDGHGYLYVNRTTSPPKFSWYWSR